MKAYQKILNGRDATRVAIVQTPPCFLDREKTLDIACSKIREAASAGANVITFSEAWVSGYPYWGEGWESQLGNWIEVRTAFFDNAILIPSEDTERLCEAAAQANAIVVIGCNELDSDPASQTIYNTLLFIDNHGKILGKHRKIMPTFVERAVWGNGDGSQMQVYDTEFGRIGGLICGEHLMTLARAHMISQGEEIHLGVFPGAFRLHTGPYLEVQDDSGEHFWGYASCRAHSFEAGAFVLASCGIMTQEALPSDFALQDTLNIDYANGGSVVYAPTAVPMTGPVYGDEIIYTDCPAQMIKVAKAIIDTCGHYSRSDLFSLKVGENVPTAAKQAVRAVESSSPGQLNEIADAHEVARSDIESVTEEMATNAQA